MIWSKLSIVAAPLAVMFLVVSVGCAPRVIVRANPGPSDTGIRYYRPKPYLKIEPAEIAVDRTSSAFVPGLVRISLAYLPDFSEEYAIDVRTGFGTADVGIKLEDGWNLTEISQDLDSQTDENLRAAASMLSAVGGILPTTEKGSDVTFTVPARNVPLGFYEAVIGRDGTGCKRLYGFRYVGFVPYANCPVEMHGHEHQCCDDPLASLYGLTFHQGEMVFQPLSWLASAGAAAAADPTAMPTPAAGIEQGVAPEEVAVEIDVQQLAIQLRSHLAMLSDGVAEVQVTHRGSEAQAEILVAPAMPVLPLRKAAEEWLREKTGFSWNVNISSTPLR